MGKCSRDWNESFPRYVVVFVHKTFPTAKRLNYYLGYIEFHRSVRFTWVQKLFYNKAWITNRRGTRDQARDYCMKLESRVKGPFEHGDWRLGGAGTRTDLLAVADRVQQGAKESDIASEYPVQFIKYTRGINTLINLTTTPRTQPPEIILCYGLTGTGKTKYCYDKYPLLYRKPCDTRWFDRYQGQDVLLLDDFGGKMSKMTCLYLLQLLDRYPLLVEAKGTYMTLLATTIIITTNHHPRLWYDWEGREESYAAMKRRIHKVLHFVEFGKAAVDCDMDMFFDNWIPAYEPSIYCIPKDLHDLTTEEESSHESDDSDVEYVGETQIVNRDFVAPRPTTPKGN